MVEVIGKTIGLLNEVKLLDDNFMFLGCLGVETSYSTWKTTYGALKEDLSSVFMNSLCSDIENRLNRIEDNINNGNGTLYLNKNSDYTEIISSEVGFKNTLTFNDSAHFYCSDDRQSDSEYKVILPKNTYKDPNGNNGNNFICNDNTRIATNLDIINAINNLKLELYYKSELIMDINYQLYKDNGVAVYPYYKNTNYIYDSTSKEPNTFYRYAGIKTPLDGTNESAKSDGIVFKNISGKYTGIPLTKSYKNFKTLTIYTSSEPSNTSANESERIYAINISVNDLNIARLYKDYKTLYKHKTNGKCYFENIADRFYLGDAWDGEIYLNLKVSATFTDTFIPIMTKLNNMIIISVIGNN